MIDLARMLDIAREAVSIGADLLRTSTPHLIRAKSDRDTVTDVDVKIEQEIQAYLLRATPGIGFLGEEHGQAPESNHQIVWTLDPIDGTSNFAHGVPLCAVSLALVSQHQPVVATITAPFLGLRYYAIKNAGAFVNGERMHTSRTGELRQAVVSVGDYAVGVNAVSKNKRRLEITALLAEQAERVRMFGSAALDLAWVAEGRTDATVIMANKPWDTAAGTLLAREAGAVVTDARGDQHTFNSSETIAISPGIASELLSLIRPVGEE